MRDGREFDPAPVPGKLTGFVLHSQDITFSMSAGGGGYGDPLDRDPQQVLTDVTYGYISQDGARNDYGVVVRCALGKGPQLPERWEVDQDATRALRERRKGERKESVLVPATKPTSVGGRHLCFAAAAMLKEIDVTAGQPVEILNPFGAPLRLWVEEDSVPNWTVAIDERALCVLRASFGERRLVRPLRNVSS